MIYHIAFLFSTLYWGVCLAALTCTFDQSRQFPIRGSGWSLARSVVQKSISIQQEIVFGICTFASPENVQPKTYGGLIGRHVLIALLTSDVKSCWFGSTLLARCLQEPQTKETSFNFQGVNLSNIKIKALNCKFPIGQGFLGHHKASATQHYKGGAYKEWPEDRPETIFLQKWTGQDRTGDTFLVIFRTGQNFFGGFRFLFIFKSILELKLLL